MNIPRRELPVRGGHALSQRTAESYSVDGDLPRFDFVSFGHNDSEYTCSVVGGDLLGIHLRRESEAAIELAGDTLDPVTGGVLLLLGRRALTADLQGVLAEVHFYVFSLQSGKVEAELVFVNILGDVGHRTPDCGLILLIAGFACGHAIEETVHLTLQVHHFVCGVPAYYCHGIKPPVGVKLSDHVIVCTPNVYSTVVPNYYYDKIVMK